MTPLYVSPDSINNRGEVVGSVGKERESCYAFLYWDGRIARLGDLGGRKCGATGINNQGLIVGMATIKHPRVRSVDAVLDYHAIIYTNGRAKDLGTMGGWTSNPATINDKGQIVGTLWQFRDKPRGFLYDLKTGITTYLPRRLQPGTINNHGVVCRGVFDRFADARAAVCEQGRVRILSKVGGFTSVANGINDAGDVVGSVQVDRDGKRHAFLYSHGKAKDLGTLGGPWSDAVRINNRGIVVGTSSLRQKRDYLNNVRHAYVYRDGKMIDLNTLLRPQSGWELEAATGINDRGEIIGTGTYNGRNVGFLLRLPASLK